MINARELFAIDYWGKYDFYTISAFRKYYFDCICRTFPSSFKSAPRKALYSFTKNPIKFIKNFIYYLPATWYMLRAFVYYRILHRNKYYSV